LGFAPQLKRNPLDRHETTMRSPAFTPLLPLALLLACRPPDRTITRGADGENDWARILAAALPLGTSADSALALMRRNGFACHADSVQLQCDKSSTETNIVHRRWQALITLDHGLVTQVHPSTGLIRP
jgi:hypothetical protein